MTITTAQQIIDRIAHYYPGAAWAWPHEGDYDTLEWHGPGAKPTLAELEAVDDPSPPVPQTITRHQLRVALHRTGNLAAAKAWIDNPGTDPELRIAMEEATLFHRSSPSLAALAVALGYGEQALDNLFRAAAKIEA